MPEGAVRAASPNASRFAFARARLPIHERNRERNNRVNEYTIASQRVADHALPQSATVVVKNGRRPRLPILALGAAALLLVGIAGMLAWQQRAMNPGLTFVIPAGSWTRVAQPTIDSAIDIPTRITFGLNDVPEISIRNEDSVAQRAGPWLVGPGQTYTARFPDPGEYAIACAVDPAESVVVTVER